jgi:hypothetical protein
MFAPTLGSNWVKKFENRCKAFLSPNILYCTYMARYLGAALNQFNTAAKLKAMYAFEESPLFQAPFTTLSQNSIFPH